MNPAFVLEVSPSLDIKLTTEAPLHCNGSAFGHRLGRLTKIYRRLDILQCCHPQDENGGKCNVCRNVWTMNWQCILYEVKDYHNSVFFFIFSVPLYLLELKLTTSSRNISRHDIEILKPPQLQLNYFLHWSRDELRHISLLTQQLAVDLYACIWELRGSYLIRHRLTWRRLVVFYIRLAGICRDTASNRPRPILSIFFSIIIHQST